MADRPAHPYTGTAGEVAELMIELEAEHHRQGWDFSPVVYRVQQGDGQPPWHVSSLCLGSLLGLHPTVELKILVEAAKEVPNGSAILEKPFDRPPLAHALIFESWARVYDSREERDKDAGKYFGDMEGSVECRSCFAVMGKEIIYYTRKRDEEPEFQVVGQDDLEEIQLSGVTQHVWDLHQLTVQWWAAKVSS